MKALETKHQTTGASVTELTDTLAALSEELQELKEKMDTRGDVVRDRLAFEIERPATNTACGKQ